MANKAEPAKSEPEKSEPAKAETATAETVKREPVKTEPAQAETARPTPTAAKAQTASDDATTAASTKPDAGKKESASTGAPPVAKGDGARGRGGPKKTPGAAPTAGPVVRLFNLNDFSGWYPYLARTAAGNTPPGKGKDPDAVFKVVNGMIRVSGQDWGTLTTEKEYDNYRLTVEFKWGAKTWGDREKQARQSGLLLHCTGADGAHLGWAPHSVKCQIIEGGTGDFVCLNTIKDKSVSFAVEAAGADGPAAKKKQAALIYEPGAPLTTITQGFIRRLGNGNDWRNVTGFHRPGDVENPTGEWNTLECTCQRDRIRIVLNGKLVNEAVNVKPARGKICLQSQGAEIFFRKVELQALTGK
jgi:hypothetical protein